MSFLDIVNDLFNGRHHHQPLRTEDSNLSQDMPPSIEQPENSNNPPSYSTIYPSAPPFIPPPMPLPLYPPNPPPVDIVPHITLSGSSCQLSRSVGFNLSLPSLPVRSRCSPSSSPSHSYSGYPPEYNQNYDEPNEIRDTNSEPASSSIQLEMPKKSFQKILDDLEAHALLRWLLHDGFSLHNQVQGTPTIVPAHPFYPNDDAEILFKTLKGFSIDEEDLVSILACRSHAQRLQISRAFTTLYEKDLLSELKSQTTGNFEDLLVAMVTPLPEFYAKELRRAMHGLGTDEDILIEIMCTKSTEEIMGIRFAYRKLYNRHLEDDLIAETSGSFKRLMVSLCSARRDESMVENLDEAKADAEALVRAEELRLDDYENIFTVVFCNRNYAQLRMICREYEELTGQDIEQGIKNVFSGDSKHTLIAIVRSIRNQPGYFAKLLHKSMKGLGTNDRNLIRLVVTRSEVDMVEVKGEYVVKYGESLADSIRSDCSGDYKKCLLYLIREA